MGLAVSMIIPASAKCDGCGKSRRDDANHWRSLGVGGPILEIQDGINDTAIYHSCGDSCTLKLVSLWLATGKLG